MDCSRVTIRSDQLRESGHAGIPRNSLQRFPAHSIEVRPVHKSKPPMAAWRDFLGQKRCLNGNGTGAAEWVEKRGWGVPAGGQQHAGGHGLPQRSLGRGKTVSAAMEKGAG